MQEGAPFGGLYVAGCMWMEMEMVQDRASGILGRPMSSSRFLHADDDDICLPES